MAASCGLGLGPAKPWWEGTNCRKNILLFLVRVTRWLLVFTPWDTLQCEESISLFQAKIHLANLIGIPNKIFAPWEETRFVLHLVLTKHCLPESIFFSRLLVFILPVQYIVFPPVVQYWLLWSQVAEDRELYMQCIWLKCWCGYAAWALTLQKKASSVTLKEWRVEE